ncbi:MAG: hypothetical protein KKH28_09365 [Elusimicrobia bacterium]|nr:hypothetical protein [Elusimicrobiota bacterium]
MNKTHILQEIKRTAEKNGGVPLGWKKFLAETGLRGRGLRGRSVVSDSAEKPPVLKIAKNRSKYFSPGSRTNDFYSVGKVF